MNKHRLIKLAKAAANGHPISSKSELEWEALVPFLEEFEFIIKCEHQDTYAKMAELTTSEILLMAGEMTPGELRTVRAVLKGIAAKIRVTKL